MSTPVVRSLRLRLMVCAIGPHEFAVPIDRVREVLPNPGLVAAPSSTLPLLGLLALPEEAVPVLDPRPAFGEQGAGEHIVVLSGAAGVCGLPVDRLPRLLTLRAGDSVTPATEGGVLPTVQGVVRHADGSLPLVDVDRLLQPDPRAVDHYRSTLPSGLPE